MEIRQICRAYSAKDDPLAWQTLGVTILGYGLCFAVAVGAFGSWLLWGLCVLGTAAFGLRLYMIQHDCMHKAYFTRRDLHDWVGTVLSVFTLAPHQVTGAIHNAHHQHVSDLDHRETFEIHTMTTAEYANAPWWVRFGYRLYRHPITLVFVGPFFLFVLVRRFPRQAVAHGLWNTVIHNALLIGYVGIVYALGGVPALVTLLAAIYVATAIGAFISYVLHNFEDIHWGRKPDLTFEKASLEGSSVLDFGPLFDYMALNIGYHDIHHLNANIPCYNLKKCHESLTDKGLVTPVRIGFTEALKCYQFKLYDEEQDRMVPFPSVLPSHQGAIRT